ncbi:hypothetical protein DPMN_169360 [Dreissena polymorpha]|uniref:Uncharacterized protein n=1 Tax=Dreissena polymorpha TaxID=45954 RepID=A0A9D4DVV2_DREPO|nr:hypothetical protein DPMN_169360 [Dreissena polymorpha]
MATYSHTTTRQILRLFDVTLTIHVQFSTSAIEPGHGQTLHHVDPYKFRTYDSLA